MFGSSGKERCRELAILLSTHSLRSVEFGTVEASELTTPQVYSAAADALLF